ncbi:MAG: glutamine amidotransferase family protein [candidate division NC10 bacterium]|nr:glutamine amidotransferase family protein [candidate division NC10 bacterium]
MTHLFQKDISACGLVGFINKKGQRLSGEVIIKAIACMRERGNGLGGGFAAYGIYPEFPDCYAFHLMYDELGAQDLTEDYLTQCYLIIKEEKIPTRPVKGINSAPLLKRYFVKPRRERLYDDFEELDPDDFVVATVMKINDGIKGAYVFSSGKNMGAFKGVGNADDIGRFYRLEEYEGYIWTAHHRFPTNTPGWWGGAHPFTLLDWSIVHNGEISSYGINKRYLEMYGYKCTLYTDTEVIAYLFDLLIRRHGLSPEMACHALAPAFWKDIDRMPEEERSALGGLRTLRMVYGSAVLNGPFAVLFGHKRGLIGFNDRIKLRPLVAATQGDLVYMASEESAIRAIAPKLEKVWAPKAGEPLIVELDPGVEPEGDK